MATKVFYGSTGGNTETVAKAIAQELGLEEPVDIADADADELNACDNLVLGVPTYDEGELQEDWDDFDFDDLDLSGKKVAIFGLGDQDSYAEYFVDAIGILASKVREKGGTLVGSWPTEGYDFEESKAVEDGKFIGLAIDEDNQDDLTDERV
ncbi:MAG: flavodoxin, partial [Fimbriimonadaceae bacterium]